MPQPATWSNRTTCGYIGQWRDAEAIPARGSLHSRNFQLASSATPRDHDLKDQFFTWATSWAGRKGRLFLLRKSAGGESANQDGKGNRRPGCFPVSRPTCQQLQALLFGKQVSLGAVKSPQNEAPGQIGCDKSQKSLDLQGTFFRLRSVLFHLISIFIQNICNVYNKIYVCIKIYTLYRKKSFFSSSVRMSLCIIKIPYILVYLASVVGYESSQ